MGGLKYSPSLALAYGCALSHKTVEANEKIPFCTMVWFSRKAQQQAEAMPVYVDHFGLADAVGSRHGLQVILGVPVAVKDDDRVGGRQIYAQATGPRAEQEGKVRGSRRVEMLHSLQGPRALLNTLCLS